MNSADSYLPLAPATFQILAALVDDTRHGYGIMQFIAEQNEGEWLVGPGTLYPALKRLLDAGLIEETDHASAEDPRRRYYCITTLGRAVAVAEANRLESALQLAARVKLIKPKLA